jgi:caa(3)-type oxidase subunit IV
VFISLGVLTILEVLSSEVFSERLRVPILLSLALVKAFLVIYFYMHLKSDSRIFALVLLIPVLIALLSALFLFSLPTNYGY